MPNPSVNQVVVKVAPFLKGNNLIYNILKPKKSGFVALFSELTPPFVVLEISKMRFSEYMKMKNKLF